MYIRLLRGMNVRMTYEDVFRYTTHTPLVARIWSVAITVGFINPFTWVLSTDLRFVVSYVLLTTFLVWTSYASIMQVLVLLASTLRRKSIFEPIAMILGYTIAFPPVFIVIQNLPYGQNTTWQALALGFVFALVCVQIILNLYIAPYIMRHLPPTEDIASPGFFGDHRKDGVHLGEHYIAFDQLLWIRSEGHNLRIKLVQDEIVLRAPLERVAKLVAPVNGYLIHRSTWVAHAAATEVQGDARVAALITTDGVRHAVARAKIATVKEWLDTGVLPHSPMDSASPTEMRIVFLFNHNTATSISQVLGWAVQADKFVLAFFSSLIMMLFNPVHFGFDLPLAFWSIFWTVTVIAFYILYPGLLTLVASTVRSLGGTVVWELPIMIIAHAMTWITVMPIGHIVAAQYDLTFTYPVSGIIFNLVVSQIAINIINLKTVREREALVEKEPRLAAHGAEAASRVTEISADDQRDLRFRILDRSFEVRDVRYVQSEGHYLRVKMKTGDAFLAGKLSTLFDQVPPTRAVSPHRSYWIMRHAIKSVLQDKGRLIIEMNDGHQINVARGKLQDMRAWLKDNKIPIQK